MAAEQREASTHEGRVGENTRLHRLIDLLGSCANVLTIEYANRQYTIGHLITETIEGVQVSTINVIAMDYTMPDAIEAAIKALEKVTGRR